MEIEKPTNPDPPRLEAFQRLVVALHLQWQMFDELFQTPKYYPIFDAVGTQFWPQLHEYLLDGLFMSVSRFFDPPKTMGRENLSLQSVINFEETQSIRSELERREKAMRAVWEKGIKAWRHRRLSHSDMATTMKVSKLPNVEFADLKKLIEDISEFARHICHKILNYDVSHEVATLGWVPTVMEHLEAGIEWHKEHRGY